MIKANFQQLSILAAAVFIDKIIVQYIGCSKHTIIMRSKPCPFEYNVLAVCENDYCYRSLFSSPITGFFQLSNLAQQVREAKEKNIPSNNITSIITAKSKTSWAVLYLMV